MTCVIAMKDKNKIHLVADKCITTGSRTNNITFPKFFEKKDDNGNLIYFGFAGWIKLLSILKYAWTLPTRNGTTTDDFVYIVKDIIPSMFRVIDSYNSLTKDGSKYYAEMLMIIIIKDKIYKITRDLNPTLIMDEFCTIGSGSDFADGALSMGLKLKSDIDRLQLAKDSIIIASEFLNNVNDNIIIASEFLNNVNDNIEWKTIEVL